jgi:hypothetical protein
VLRWSLLGHVLGLLFLADVELLSGLLALGEGVSVDWISRLSLIFESMIARGLSYPPAEPVGLEAPEPVEPSAMRRAEAEK